MAVTPVAGDIVNPLSPGMQLLSTATASAASSVVFTGIGGSASPYDILIVTCGFVEVSTDDTELLATIDYGSGEIVTGYDGLFDGHASNGTGLANVMLATAVEWCGFTGGGNGIGSTTSEGIKGGMLYIYNANDASHMTPFKCFIHWDNSGTQYSTGNSFSTQETNGAVDGITIKPGGGTITGTFKLYGVVG